MGVEENKANARRFVDEVINRGNLAAVDELTGPNFVDHSAPPGVPPTAEGAKAFFGMFHSAFPDLHATVDDVIAEGDRVVQRRTTSGTMRGDFMGMPASGKVASWSGIHIIRFVDGKLVEHWSVVDMIGMLTQLGFGPAQSQPAGVTR
jgi:steroid delta-isomerase-like uncharacterized protein